MLCSNCHKKEANVHFTGMVNEKSVKMDVCDSCADILGLPFQSLINFPTTSPSFSELFNLLSSWPKSPLWPNPQNSCNQCRWTRSQIQKTGKLGCPKCYTHFQKELSNILKTIQGSTKHQGKRVVHSDKPVKLKKEKAVSVQSNGLDKLKQELDKAVKGEKFEKAAQLRDQIRSFEKKGGS